MFVSDELDESIDYINLLEVFFLQKFGRETIGADSRLLSSQMCVVFEDLHSAYPKR